MNPLRFNQSTLLLQLLLPPGQLFQDGIDRAFLAIRLQHVVALGINRQAGIFLLHRTEEGIDLRQRFDLVAEQLNAVGHVVVGGENFNYVATHAKRAATKIGFVAVV